MTDYFKIKAIHLNFNTSKHVTSIIVNDICRHHVSNKIDLDSILKSYLKNLFNLILATCASTKLISQVLSKSSYRKHNKPDPTCCHQSGALQELILSSLDKDHTKAELLA